MRQIAFYGKGGIGKSTIAANLAVCFAEMSLRPLIIGCDPKTDSHILLTEKSYVTPVLEVIQQDLALELDDILIMGYKGVHCIEIGGPTPGVGCAGRGILVGLELLTKLGVFDNRFDIILYDVPGDVVCGGFAKPISANYAKEVYIVTSSEFLSLFAANNICIGLKNLQVPLGGIIGNARNKNMSPHLISQFANSINSQILSILPWSTSLQNGERLKKTLLQYAPLSPLADHFRELAKKILQNNKLSIPCPIDSKKLKVFWDE
ncbi:MAG: nucleotide-binding protein [Candidatus Helarchaeota archaeon]